MHRLLLLTLLCLSLLLVGSECTQPLGPVIECEIDADCVEPCAEFCQSFDEVVMSAICDANQLCECLCMPEGGTGGVGGHGGAGGG